VERVRRHPGNLLSDELNQPALAKSFTSQALVQVIQKWVDSGSALGFFFTPGLAAEGLPGEQNAKCLTTLKSLQLEITYLGKADVFPP
jgi:hypothetical protein